MSNVIPVNLEDTNEVRLAGEIEKPLEFSHKTNSESFFKTSIIIKRLSGVCDVIPLIIPNKVVDNMIHIEKGMFVELTGRFQSRKEDEKSIHLYSVRKCGMCQRERIKIYALFVEAYI